MRGWTWTCAGLVTAWSGAAAAQPDLPPPPPPPLERRDGTLLPPPPTPPPGTAARPPETTRVPAAPTPVPTAPAPPRRLRPVHRPAETRTEVEPPARPTEAPPEPTVAVTLNPLVLPWGRLSANVEFALTPLGRHHAVSVSPNVLFASVARGGPHAWMSEGFGFASTASSSVGVELGYHYFWREDRSLQGPFFGGSFLVGSTTAATVGDPTHAQGYWGLAVDVGTQEILWRGLIVGGGVGLGYMQMASTSAVFPRLLLQVGWSF